MRILDRYLTKEVTVAVGLATAAFVFILVASNILQQVVGAMAAGRITAAEGLFMCGLLFPVVLPYALPLGVLTGTLLVYGRLSAEGEITAMKSAGLSLTRIARPALLGATLLAGGALWLNLEAGPWAEDTFERILKDSARQNPATLIVPGVLNRRFKNVVLWTKEREGEELKDFWFWRYDDQGNQTESLHAETARVFVRVDTQGQSQLQLVLTHARREAAASPAAGQGSTSSAQLADQVILDLPASLILPTQGTYLKRLRMMTGRELVAAHQQGWQLAPNASPSEIERNKTMVLVQIMARLTTACSVLSLALLAIPLAVKVGRAEATVNGPLALAVALSYYTLTQAAGWIKDPSLHPEFLIWIPNLLLLGLGGWLLRKAQLH